MKINFLNYKNLMLCLLLFFSPIYSAFSSSLDELFYQLKNAENQNLAKAALPCTSFTLRTLESYRTLPPLMFPASHTPTHSD